MKTLVRTARHSLRSMAQQGKMFLVLSGSLSSICAIQKGRSSAKALLGPLRSVASLLLGTEGRMHVRWICSEDNPADGPSRGRRVSLFRPSYQYPAQVAAHNLKVAEQQDVS